MTAPFEFEVTRDVAAGILADHVRCGTIRAWERNGDRWVIAYDELDAFAERDGPRRTERVEIVLSFPQVKGFLCGLSAGLGWVGRVAEQVDEEQRRSS